MILQFCCY